MVEELVELAQGVSDAKEFEAAVLERLLALVGFDVGFVSLRGNESDPTSVGLSRPLIELAVGRADAYASELLPVKRAALAGRGAAVDTEVLGEASVRKSCYHRELASRVNGRHSLIAPLIFRGEPIGMLMLGRCGGTFSSRARSRVEALLPALAVTRAAFGLPFRPRPLPSPPAPWTRLGFRGGLRAEVLTETGRVQVRDRGDFREMMALGADGSKLVWTRARRTDPGESGWPYVDLFHVAAAGAGGRERALFIGAGGAVALQQFAAVYPGIHLELVERDPHVIDLSREWFALDSLPRLTVAIDDGVAFVARSEPGRWDIVVVDAFDAGGTPSPFVEEPFLSSVARALRPAGAVTMNWIGCLSDPALSGLVRRLERWFQSVRVLPVVEAGELDPHAPRNVVLAATRRRVIRSP